MVLSEPGFEHSLMRLKEHATAYVLAFACCNGAALTDPGVQANKSDEEQPLIADTLQAFDLSTAADVCVIGCGPAGLALSSELAKQGLSVCLIGGLHMLCSILLPVLALHACQAQAHRI